MTGPLFAARRLFLRNRKDGRQGHPLAGAALGIALSLIPLVTVDHVAEGMISGILDRYRETSTFHLQIHTWTEPDREDWEDLEASLLEREDLSGAWIERQGFGLARAGESREGLSLRALPPDLDIRDPSFLSYLDFDSGAWDLSEGDSLLLGREAARRLGADTGDTIRVLTARLLPDGRAVPRVSRFIIKGIFSTGYQDLDRTWALIPLETGWNILSEESAVTFVGAKIPNPEAGTPEVREALAGDLDARWIVYDWRGLNRYLLDNLNTTRTILLFLMALIIIVAVLNVLSSLIMLTLERRREIGILKCAGTSPEAITQTFVIAGMMAALVGTLAGLSGGMIVARYINEIIRLVEFLLGSLTSLVSDTASPPRLLDEGYYLQTIPINLRWGRTVLVGLVTLILSFCASAIPASHASRLKPLEVMRKH